LRELALTQALKTDVIGNPSVDSSDYDKDKKLSLSAEKLFIKKNAVNLGGGKYLDIVFNDGDNTILFTTNANYNPATRHFADPYIYITQT